MEMYQQLRAIKRSFDNFIKLNKNDNHGTKLRLIIGNESADLDSIVSSISLSLAKNSQYKLDEENYYENALSVPLINIPKDDIYLRPEAIYLFKLCKLSLEDILFIDDPLITEFKSLLNSNTKLNFDFTLVDHNVLHPTFTSWNGKVSEIIDHHQDENKHMDVEVRDIRPVGSATTLIVDYINNLINNGNIQYNILEVDHMSHFLLAPILIDTVNLKGEYGRVTDLDKKVANQLLNILKVDKKEEMFSFDNYFNLLNEAKKDCESMSTLQLLKRDFKLWDIHSKGLKLGMSSIINFNLQDWKSRNLKLNEKEGYEDMVNSCKKFQEQLSLNVLVILLSKEYPADNSFKREFVLYSQDKNLLNYLKKELEKCNTLNLVQSDNINNTFLVQKSILCYEQVNIAASRKVSYPIIRDILEKYTPKL